MTTFSIVLLAFRTCAPNITMRTFRNNRRRINRLSIDRSFGSDMKDIQIYKYISSSPEKKTINWSNSYEGKDSTSRQSKEDTDVLWEEPISYTSSSSKSTGGNSSAGYSRPSSKKSSSPAVSTPSGDAQKKFGAAKSISSAQYFGDNDSNVS